MPVQDTNVAHRRVQLDDLIMESWVDVVGHGLSLTRPMKCRIHFRLEKDSHGLETDLSHGQLMEMLLTLQSIWVQIGGGKMPEVVDWRNGR